MSGTPRFWLEDWMIEYDIQSNEDYSRAISSPTVVKSLYERIDQKENRTHNHTSQFPPHAVLAGRHLDLSATYHHPCVGCFSAELSSLITETMHFFDTLVVSGPSALKTSSLLQSKRKDERGRIFNELRSHVNFLNYIQRIGLRDLLIFAPKFDHYCDECFSKWASESGFAALDGGEQAQLIVGRLVSEAKFISMRDRSGKWKTTVQHPFLKGGSWTRKTPFKNRPTKKKIAWDIFSNLSKPPVYDISTARHYKLPLIEGYQAAWLTTPIDYPDVRPAVDDVALRLRIPTLTGLPLEEIARIQNEDKVELVTFQHAVSSAIREMIKERETDSAERIAAAVLKEYIEPELAAIESRLRSKQRAFGKKFAASAILGVTTTTVGLIAAMPLVLATGVGAAVTALPQLYKYIDDKSEIETSDLYFLSRVQENNH